MKVLTFERERLARRQPGDDLERLVELIGARAHVGVETEGRVLFGPRAQARTEEEASTRERVDRHAPLGHFPRQLAWER